MTRLRGVSLTKRSVGQRYSPSATACAVCIDAVSFSGAELAFTRRCSAERSPSTAAGLAGLVPVGWLVRKLGPHPAPQCGRLPPFPGIARRIRFGQPPRPRLSHRGLGRARAQVHLETLSRDWLVIDRVRSCFPIRASGAVMLLANGSHYPVLPRRR